MKIQVNGKDVTLKLSWKAIQNLKQKWGFSTINEVMARLETSFTNLDYDAAIEILTEMTGGALTFDQTGEWLFDNMHRLAEVFAAVQGDATDPNPAPEGNPEALTVTGAQTVDPQA